MDEWMGKERGGPAASHVCRAPSAAHPPRAARRLVSGAGDIKLTKDGNVLLQEMVSWGWSSQGDLGRNERLWVKGNRVPRCPTHPYSLNPKCLLRGG